VARTNLDLDTLRTLVVAHDCGRRLATLVGMRMLTRLSILAALLLSVSVPALAQAQAPSIAGTWVLTAAEKLLADGTRVPDYGPNPHGLAIFTADGYYSVQIYRAERVKFASGDKFKGSADEYKDVSLGMSVHFGRYSVDPVKKTITFKIDRSSVPNVDDTTAVRAYELNGNGNELTWKVAPRQDGSVPLTTLRRVTDR
jgi:hypothetical protein